MKQFLKKPLGLAVAATLAIGGMAAYTNATAELMQTRWVIWHLCLTTQYVTVT